MTFRKSCFSYLLLWSKSPQNLMAKITHTCYLTVSVSQERVAAQLGSLFRGLSQGVSWATVISRFTWDRTCFQVHPWPWVSFNSLWLNWGLSSSLTAGWRPPACQAGLSVGRRVALSSSKWLSESAREHERDGGHHPSSPDPRSSNCSLLPYSLH